MEAFAEEEIEREMKRLTSGAGGITEYDDEDISFSGSDEEKPSKAEKKAAKAAAKESKEEKKVEVKEKAKPEKQSKKPAAAEVEDSEEDFFSGDEELEDVNLDGEDDESEAEFGS
jgi:hypothetical protein